MKTIEDYVEKGVFLINIGDVCFHVPRFCPHRAGRLDHGRLNIHAKTVMCPLHKSVFNLETGEQVSGPSCGSLKITKSQIGVKKT